MEYITIILKIIFFYFFIMLAYRIMGKREVGQLGVMDLIISFLIAELVALSIGNNTKPFLHTIIPVGFLVFFQYLMAFLSLKLPILRYVFDGQPSIIINHGRLNFKEMTKQRYNLDDLLLQLREKGIKNIEEVEYAVLENNGKLSTFKYNEFEIDHYFPLPLILDGKIQLETLRRLKRNEQWLKEMLEKEQVPIDNVFYAFYKGNKTYIIKRENLDLN